MSYRLVVTQLHNGSEVASAHQGGSATQAKQSAPVTVGNGTAPSAPVIDLRAMRLQLYGSNYIAELEAFAMGRDPKGDACDMIMSCVAREYVQDNTMVLEFSRPVKARHWHLQRWGDALPADTGVLPAHFKLEEGVSYEEWEARCVPR